jgi:D-alanine-D-alanine ligase
MNIALITGGFSAEREVSITSSISILKALRESGHSVRLIDPVYGKDQPGEDTILGESVKKISPSLEKLDEIQRTSGKKAIECFSSGIFDDIDFVFLGLHGKFGEDGKIQSLIEMRSIPYSGSGVLSSAISLDKDISKVILKYYGINTPKWLSFTRESYDPGKVTEKINRDFNYKCVIKPNDEGSTIGLSVIEPDAGEDILKEKIDLAFRYSSKVLVEEFINGRELTVPVVGVEAYPVIEIKPEGGFYDYEHKYTKGMTNYICPAEINKEIEYNAKNLALCAHKALNCDVYSRVDFMMNDKDELFCLEVNTLPGMTETSLVPKSAKVMDISFNELIEKIIKLSMNKKSL